LYDFIGMIEKRQCVFGKDLKRPILELLINTLVFAFINPVDYLLR
jgi:hypothetical protein